MEYVVYLMSGYDDYENGLMCHPDKILFRGGYEECKDWYDDKYDDYYQWDGKSRFQEWLEIGTEQSFEERKDRIDRLEKELEEEYLGGRY